MIVNYGPKGILQLDDARIIYRNFEGRGDKFNRQGDRNYAVIIPNEELAYELQDKGWNVKIKPPRSEEEEPFMFLPVKVKFTDFGPTVYLKTGEKMNRLDEEGIACLDNIDISTVDMDIRPYDWEVNGKTGRTAYLHSICVTQNVDRFAARYTNNEPNEY